MTWADLHGVLRGLVPSGLNARPAPPAVFVTGIASDSRAVEPGNVFVALKGLHADGTQFATQAVDRKAAVVVSEDRRTGPGGAMGGGLGLRPALALLAAAFFSSKRRDAGRRITGTNGKTTTAYLVAAIFEQARIRCGLMGTVAYKIGNTVRSDARPLPKRQPFRTVAKWSPPAAAPARWKSHRTRCRCGASTGMSFAAAVFAI
jgi:UDP-N-acetylmuramoyl-L-alanyl-D-glutamate--2,6-diaminopimelate ligase